MGKGEVRHFTDLIVWQRARKVRNRIYEIATELLDFERYNLISQLTRAACYVTANIAEGYGRYYYKENIKILYGYIHFLPNGIRQNKNSK